MRSTEIDPKPAARARSISASVGLRRLHAIDGALYGGIEVLHAEAQAVEAERRQPVDVLGVTVRGSTSMEYSRAGLRVS